MMKKASLASALIVVIFFGCGHSPMGSGPVFTMERPVDGKAKIVHYRIGGPILGGIFYHLYTDGRIVAKIGNGGYFVQELPPGEYNYSVRQDVALQMGVNTADVAAMREKVWDVMKVNAEPGKTYFYKWNVTEKYRAETVEESVALQEIKGLPLFQFEMEAYISQVRNAFEEVTYPGDDLLVREDCQSSNRLIDGFMGNKADQVTSNILDSHSYDFTCFTSEARRYYLPAFLRQGLIYQDSAINEHMILAFNDRQGWDPPGGYTKEQVEIINRYIEYIKMFVVDNDFDPVYESARDFWMEKAEKLN